MAPPEPLKLIAALLAAQLGLAMDGPNPRVFIYNNNWPLPTDDRMLVVVAFDHGMVFGAEDLSYDGSGTGLNEVQNLNVRETYSINCYSTGPEARLRFYDPIFALNSTASEQMQEANSLQIFNIPEGPLDASREEGSRIQNRYITTFNLNRAVSKQQAVEYYNPPFPIPAPILVNP